MNEIDVKKIREKLGITQAELAKRLGVTNKTVSNWEVTGNIPTPMRLKLEELDKNMSERRDATDHVGRLLDIMEADRKFYQSQIEHDKEQIDRLITIIEGRSALQSEEKKTNVG